MTFFELEFRIYFSTFEDIVSNLVYLFCDLLANFRVSSVHNMSIFDYFTKNKEGKAQERVVKTLPTKEDYEIISGKEYDSIKDTFDVHPETKKKRVTYKEKQR